MIQQRLLMHLLVLEDRQRRLGVARCGTAPSSIGPSHNARENQIIRIAVRTSACRSRDGQKSVGVFAASSSSGSMPRAKSDLESSYRSRHASTPASERIDRERREVALVENDRIAKRDRTVVIRLGRGNREQLSARSLPPRDTSDGSGLAVSPSRKCGVFHRRIVLLLQANAGSPIGTSMTRKGGDPGSSPRAAAWPRCRPARSFGPSLRASRDARGRGRRRCTR